MEKTGAIIPDVKVELVKKALTDAGFTDVKIERQPGSEALGGINTVLITHRLDQTTALAEVMKKVLQPVDGKIIAIKT